MTAYFSKVDAVEEPVAAVPWSEESVRGTETILVVEDDAGLRALLNMGLGALGYKVLLACDGPEALAICAGDIRVDLLLTDVVMPGVNGRELMEHLTARVPGLKTLFMSGFTNDILGSKGLGGRPRRPPKWAREGVLDAETILLRKPFTVAEAAREIRPALGPT